MKWLKRAGRQRTNPAKGGRREESFLSIGEALCAQAPSAAAGTDLAPGMPTGGGTPAGFRLGSTNRMTQHAHRMPPTAMRFSCLTGR